MSLDVAEVKKALKCKRLALSVSDMTLSHFLEDTHWAEDGGSRISNLATCLAAQVNLHLQPCRRHPCRHRRSETPLYRLHSVVQLLQHRPHPIDPQYLRED
jgi:hypothetical protein